METKQMPEMFLTPKLFCPGPTPVPMGSSLAALDTAVYHRSEEFYTEFLECRRLLMDCMDSDELPIILSCSGTGALESAVVNFTYPNQQVLVLNGGKFGERWEKLCKAYSCQVNVIKVGNGDSVSATDFESYLAKLKSNPPEVFFMQANETSTGVYHRPEILIPILKKVFPQCMVVVDAISALCAHPIGLKSEGVDVLISASQKGLGIPPGLAFVAVAKSAWSKYQGGRAKFYFDLKKEFDGQAKGRSAWTSSISLIKSLHWTLSYLQREGGIHRMVAQHRKLAVATRQAVEAIGLNLFVKEPAYRSNALTAIEVPSGIDGKLVLSHLKKKYGMIFAGGQDDLSGKILRLAHLGFVDRFMMLQAIAALEWTLHDLRVAPKKMGDGVKTFMQSLSVE